MTPSAFQPRRRSVISLAAAALAGGLFPMLSLADSDTTYPTRPVTIVVPFAPGGGTDIVARLLATELSRRWNVGVIVENKPGAGGQIGSAFVAKAAPDGYTLMLGITTLIQAPSLYKSLPYDVFKDFTPLAQLATSVNFFAVPVASPANSLKEYLALVRSRGGKASYGSNGNAGTSHLHGALLNATQKLDMVHAPYSGSGPLLNALLGQQVDGAFVDVAPLRPHVQAGKLKVLAVTGPRRSTTFPDVPTLEELGIPGFDPVGWFALFGPAGMPAAVRSKVSAATMDVLRAPETVKRIEELGLTPSQLSQQAFADSMRTDLVKWQKMIQAGNVSVE
ncbi:tripartite tricarboxylate transporter substrate binding protein [Variovorax rhizosphaerae]|uniref:Tripartite tricarboxylate transporter substrate binding protein n=1 Tax=Variovorax rhizosphaerae TaxID=1836200 RepID=A0ABU8WFD2_9BURK